MLLIGIVKKNAIMMIDFALRRERDEGKSPREAIYQACLLRFRPIMMTTMAAMLGALPLMVGTGTGSELRQPLGIAIVGGLIVSQMLTLFTTPVIYLASTAWPGVWARPVRAKRLVAREGRPNELLRALHPPTDRDHFAHARDRARRRYGLCQLPVSPLPQVDFPTISVQAPLPGASPEMVATSVAEPLEKHLGAIADVAEMTS